MLTRRITEIAEQSGFPIWIAIANANHTCELVRASAFMVEPDRQHIEVCIPNSMRAQVKEVLIKDAPISFLLASLNDFESYQVKGTIVDIETCDSARLSKQLDLLEETIALSNAFGLNGKKILGFLAEGPFTVIRMSCLEVFEQTPKPGTGTKIEALDEK